MCGKMLLRLMYSPGGLPAIDNFCRPSPAPLPRKHRGRKDAALPVICLKQRLNIPCSHASKCHELQGADFWPACPHPAAPHARHKANITIAAGAPWD